MVGKCWKVSNMLGSLPTAGLRDVHAGEAHVAFHAEIETAHFCAQTKTGYWFCPSQGSVARSQRLTQETFMKSVLSFPRCGVILAAIFLAASSLPSLAQEEGPAAVKNILLVHGAWADGSSWDKVIPILQERGFHVTAVQLSLASLENDVAITKRAIALENGPVLLAGHSYGGAVISEAGNDPKVAGLVFVAAFAPDTNESSLSLLKQGPPTPIATELRPDSAGFLKLTEKGVFEDFAPQLPLKERATLFVTQGPTSGAALGTPASGSPAWRSKPDWYIVAAEDRTISPDLERTMAQRMGAVTITLPSCHVAMLAEPEEVARFIVRAASGQGK
jgi:pimeloyl-ACP methyl ester carboxylesterase